MRTIICDSSLSSPLTGKANDIIAKCTTTAWPSASWQRADLSLTLPDPGWHRGEAAIVAGSYCCDRNRCGAKQDEFYHGKISIFEPSSTAILVPVCGLPLSFQINQLLHERFRGSKLMSAKLTPDMSLKALQTARSIGTARQKKG